MTGDPRADIDRMRFLLATIASVAAGAAFAAGPAAASSGCTVVGAPDGDDRAAGTVERPLRTAQAVIDALRPGSTGCLRAGTYDDRVIGPYVANVSTSGRPGAPITLRSFPGERARLRGVTVVRHETSHVVLRDLTFEGPSARRSDTTIAITVLGKDITFADNDVTARDSSCLALGGNGAWGTTRNPLVRGNRFTGCGTRGDLLEHAIYGNAVRGGRITGNLITGSSGYAVNLHGSNSGLRIDRNVMVGNGGGVIFSGAGSRYSRRVLVTRNVIADSQRRGGVSAWWSGSVGFGNLSVRNCMARNRWDSNTENPGYRRRGNVEADPQFGAGGDLRMGAGSACRAVIGSDPAAAVLAARAAAG